MPASLENCSAASSVTLFDRLAWFEFIRVEEDRLERFESFGGEQVIQRQGDRARGKVGVIGADDDGVDV